MLFIFKAFLFLSTLVASIISLFWRWKCYLALHYQKIFLTQSRFRGLNLAKTKPTAHKSSDLFFSCLHLPTKEFQLFQPTSHPVISARPEKLGSDKPGNSHGEPHPQIRSCHNHQFSFNFSKKRLLTLN